MKNLQRRKTLIRKLFKEVAKETIGAENLGRVKLLILTRSRRWSSYCKYFYDNSITIGLNLKGLEYTIKEGYTSCYYKDRPERLNKYIINNRHNALRFILYHEARHAWQRINGKNRDNEYQQEYDADSWALAHIKTRPQNRKTTRPDQTRKPVKTFIPKVTEYIRLYNLGYSTSKIAKIYGIKDPRSVRYYLTKAGISLRRKENG